MKYIIIGLGNYGFKLAEDLSAIGCEVIGVDSSESKIEAIKDEVATAFTLDATDEQALAVLPLNSVDVVIVAIGENFGASVRVVALLKRYKVQHIYARAIDDIHRAVLEAFSLDRILSPEQDAASNLVQEMEFSNIAVASFKIDSDYYVVKFCLPERFIGYSLNDLNWDQEFGIKIIGVVRGNHVENCLGIGITEMHVDNSLPVADLIKDKDMLVCYGKQLDFQRLWRKLA